MTDGNQRRRWGRLAALLVWALAMTVSACQTRVQQGLDEREADEVVAALRRAGLEAEKVKERGRRRRYAVQVPRGQVSRAVKVILAQALPRRRPPGFDQTYRQPSLVPGRAEQRARYEQALAGEISRTLEAAGGVLEARVHLVVPDRHPLALRDKPPPPPQAAVFLRVRPGPPPLSGAEIRRLVAASVHGLDPTRVEVIVHRTPPPPGSEAGPRLAHVGPVTVTADSRRLLLWIFASGLLALLLCGAAMAYLAWRLRRASRFHRPSGQA